MSVYFVSFFALLELPGACLGHLWALWGPCLDLLVRFLALPSRLGHAREAEEAITPLEFSGVISTRD